MYIGEFASLAGVTPKTIRHYESIGLLPSPTRKGNYRIYDTTYIETVVQIKQAQDFGFNLSEIKSYMEGVDIRRGLPANTIHLAIGNKLSQIKSEISVLHKKETLLLQLQTELRKSVCAVDSAL